MKIINESKEKLPLTIITDAISHGWNSVGDLQSQIESITKYYQNGKNAADILQKLADAYLICIGQLEALLQDKDYIDLPEGGALKEDVEIKINKDAIQVSNDGEFVAEIPNPENNAEETKAEDEETCPECGEDAEEPENPEDDIKVVEPKADGETFDFFVDFDEPAKNVVPMSDKEIEELMK